MSKPSIKLPEEVLENVNHTNGNRNGRSKPTLGPQNTGLATKSEEMRDMMGRSPGWLLRWGIFSLLLIILSVLGTSWFVTYPDQIEASVTLVSDRPPASIVAQQSGYLLLLVEDQQQVTKNMLLGHIEDPRIDFEEVVKLKQSLIEFKAQLTEHAIIDLRKQWPKDLQLGDITSSYLSFLHVLNEIKHTTDLGEVRFELHAVLKEIENTQKLNAVESIQNHLSKQEFEIAKKKYEVDSSLWARKSISEWEYYQSLQSYLSAKKSIANLSAATINSEVKVDQLNDRSEQLKRKQKEQAYRHLKETLQAVEQLEQQILSWEKQYLFYAPIEGQVSFFNYWHDSEYINSGEEVMVIVRDPGQLFGKVELPMAGSGKVEKGQRVIIRFDNYPHNEFGEVEGLVGNTSLIPKDNNYLIRVILPNGLTTSYQNELPFRQSMKGQARILTKEQRLLQKILSKLTESMDKALE